jgi:hypothetical protein
MAKPLTAAHLQLRFYNKHLLPLMDWVARIVSIFFTKINKTINKNK